MLNHKEVAFLLGITTEKLSELIEHGMTLPISKAIAKLEVTSVHGDICVSDEQLDKFISAFEAEEPGRHPPVTVRRDLLTEANHRCGICRSPVARLQFHHMVEWSKIQHHDPKHMIAICGTCHDHCGVGVIDKKAQEMYKARLQRPHYLTEGDLGAKRKTCESVAAPCAPEQQEATLLPSEVRLPGFSFHMMIRINNIPGARRKYIFDMGCASAERLSIYVSSDNILTLQFVDAKHEVHPLQLPFGSCGLSIGKFAYLACELGISGSTTELRLYCDGERIGEQILPFKTGHWIIGPAECRAWGGPRRIRRGIFRHQRFGGLHRDLYNRKSGNSCRVLRLAKGRGHPVCRIQWKAVDASFETSASGELWTLPKRISSEISNS